MSPERKNPKRTVFHQGSNSFHSIGNISPRGTNSRTFNKVASRSENMYWKGTVLMFSSKRIYKMLGSPTSA
jgi:hypothetical protein